MTILKKSPKCGKTQIKYVKTQTKKYIIIIYRYTFMIKKYRCKICEYQTNNKYDFKRHSNTKKHMKLVSNNIKKSTKNVSNGTEIVPSRTQIKCEYCKKSISTKKSLKRHHKTCKEYMKHQIEEDKDIIIEELRNKLEEKDIKIEEKDKKIAGLENTEKEYFDMLKTISKDTKAIINNTTNNNTINNTVNMYYIINKYKNASNYKELMEPPLTQEEKTYTIDNGALSGCYNLLMNRCINNVELSDRPFHCVDASRSKYLLRVNDDWDIDNGGEKILREAYPKIKGVYEIDKKIDDMDGEEMDEYIKGASEIIKLEKKGKKIIMKELNKKALLKNNINKLIINDKIDDVKI